MESKSIPVSMVEECCDYQVEHRPDGGATIRIEVDPRFVTLWMVKLSELRTTLAEIEEHEPKRRS